MIDYEVDIFDEVATAVLSKFKNAFVSSEYVEAPSDFPAVSVIETGNLPDLQRESTSYVEEMALVTYEVNVFTNSGADAKSDCKKIVDIIDGVFRDCNMTRIFCRPIDNFKDPSIYRMVARYNGAVNKEFVMYKR